MGLTKIKVYSGILPLIAPRNAPVRLFFCRAALPAILLFHIRTPVLDYMPVYLHPGIQHWIMIVFPHAKINLGLKVVGRRSDGYHDISSILFPIGLADALEIVPATDSGTIFTASGLPVAGDIEDNLCMRAYRLMQKKYNLPPVRIHLHKVIPSGAGLGGGSSDAAFTLKLLNRLFETGAGESELQGMASQLGSDCPFFICKEPALATGRGEVLAPVTLNLKNYFLLLVKPGVEVSTADAYGMVTPSGSGLPDPFALPNDIREWQNLLINDFELPVIQAHPVIGEVKRKLTEMGAAFASMSGSGSSVFGLFEHAPVYKPGDFEGMFIWSERL